MKSLLYYLVLMTFSISMMGQESGLPVYKTPEEKAKEADYRPLVVKGITHPPVSPIRNAAEWEEMQGVLISWKTGYESFLSQIIKYAKEEATVYIYCSDSTTVKNYLTSHNITTTNTRYLVASLNSVWIRDYGPNNIYTNNVDSLYLVDWVYNRPRPQDDASPQQFANLLSLPLYQCTQPPTDLVATGGNFVSDGLGTAFSSDLILNENATTSSYNQTPKTEQDINNIANDYLGITNYIKMDVLPYDGIHHIDMHFKMLDEETLLVGQYPTGISDGPQIETNLNYVLNNFTSVFGTPFRVVRIPMPPTTGGSWPSNGGYYLTYTNSLIINKIILVPTYYQQYDTTALRIYQEAMPGYKVIGINANNIISQSGAIHCTTHEIGAYNPLLISHQRLRNTDNIWTNYTVNAMIIHKSGVQEARIYFRTDTTQPFTWVPMSLTNTPNSTWTGEIPVQTSGTMIYYYIWAKANSGKEQVRPMPAPDGYWNFYVYNPLSVQEINNDNFSCKPTYNQNQLTLNIYTTTEMHAEIVLLNSIGQPVQQLYYGNLFQGYQAINNNIPLAKGMYMVVIETSKGKKVEKIAIY